MDLEEKLGKLAFKAFATKTQGAVDLIVWTLDAIKDLLVTELANHQDFKGVPFTGKGNNKGLMDVIIFKQPLLHHFLYQTLPDCGMSSGDMDILRQFQTHDAFRKKCGGGKVKVDLQWQGFLSEAAVKAIGFLHIVIYGTKLDGNLKVSLKGTSNAGEMMEQAGIKELIDEINKQWRTSTLPSQTTSPRLWARFRVVTRSRMRRGQHFLSENICRRLVFVICLAA